MAVRWHNVSLVGSSTQDGRNKNPRGGAYALVVAAVHLLESGAEELLTCWLNYWSLSRRVRPGVAIRFF